MHPDNKWSRTFIMSAGREANFGGGRAFKRFFPKPILSSFVTTEPNTTGCVAIPRTKRYASAAVVTPSSATGVVTFYSGTTVLEIEPLVNGQATLTTILLPSGVQPLKAYYLGNSNDGPSTSAILAQTVNALPGNGFQTELDSTVSTAYNVAMGDFNGDGKADLIAFGQAWACC